MSNLTLENEQKQLIETEVAPVVKMANDLVVKSDDQSLEAQEILKNIKSKRKKISDFFGPMKTKAHAAWKEICNSESFVDAPLEQAERTVKNKVITYSQEVERKRQEEARLAEAKRLEAERKEREKLEEQARKAEANGKTEKAEALREKAEQVVVQPTFIAPAAAPKTNGTAFKKVWKGECTDLLALCKAIAEGRAPVSLVVASQSEINSYAKVIKDTMQVPGLKISEVTEMAVRA